MSDAPTYPKLHGCHCTLSNVVFMSKYLISPDDPRMITPADLIGAAEVCRLLGINRSTVVRRVKAGTLPCLAKLDGSSGALVFDRNDIMPLVSEA